MTTSPDVPPDAPTRATDRQPRTERGRRTARKLLDAAAAEFAEKGFHEASISGITSRAGTALGSFYTYFESKEAIFRALVHDMSERVRIAAGSALTPELTPLETERAALAGFMRFARENKEVYRIVDESEFVDPASHRTHYETTARRILERLRKGVEQGVYRDDLGEADAWAIMGMNVFLGLRYSIWSDADSIDEAADAASAILGRGITASAVQERAGG